MANTSARGACLAHLVRPAITAKFAHLTFRPFCLRPKNCFTSRPNANPIGATGAILTTKLTHSMRRDGLKRGIVTLCIGGGQGIALAIEAVH